MELTNIREIFRNKDKFADKEVTIGGWVRSNRNSKNFWIYRGKRRYIF